jgi:hypothetical protein
MNESDNGRVTPLDRPVVRSIRKNVMTLTQDRNANCRVKVFAMPIGAWQHR